MGEEESRRRRQWQPCLATALLLTCWVSAASGDFAADQKECAPSLTGLMTCLDFVEGTSIAPPLDCCSGLKEIIANSERCLCILIKDRNEPQLPFKINATRAISLPSICKHPTNITHCIDLLKMDSDSKEAQIFKQNGSPINTTGNGIKQPGGGGGATAGTAAGSAAAVGEPGGGLWELLAWGFLSLVFLSG